MSRGTSSNLNINIGATNNAKGVFSSVISDLLGISGSSSKAGQSFQDLGRRVIEGTIVWHAFRTAVQGVKESIVSTIDAGIKWQSVMADVQRTVEGTPEQIAKIGVEIRNMAKEMPVAANELAKIAAMAGQLGVKTEDVTRFTEVIAKLSVTTNLVGEKGAQSIARFNNIMGLTGTQINTFADVLVKLGVSSAATETDIMNMGLRIAGAGRAIGMSSSDVLALATALSDVGIRAEMGGSAISRVMIDISKAVSEGGLSLHNFAAVAGKSSEDFAKIFKDDAAVALDLFIEGLKHVQVTGGNVFQTLNALDENGQRVIDTLLRISGSSKSFGDALKIANTAVAEGGTLNAAYGVKSATVASQIQILKNQIHDVQIELGTALMPVVVELLGGFTSFIERLRVLEPVLAGVAAILPSLISSLVVFGAALVGLKIAAFTSSLLAMGTAASTIVTYTTTAGLGITGMTTTAIPATNALTALRGSMLAFLGTPLGALTAVSAAFLVIDVALKKSTGYGLGAHLFKDIDLLERGEKALKSINTEIYGLKDGAGAADIWGKALKRDIENIDKLLAGREKLAKAPSGFMQKIYPDVMIGKKTISEDKEFKHLKNMIEEEIKELVRLKAPLDEVVQLYDDSSKAIKKVISDALEDSGILIEDLDAKETVLGKYINKWKEARGLLSEEPSVPPIISEEQLLLDKEKLEKAVKEFEEIIKSILPTVDETFAQWEARMDVFISAQSNAGRNYELILALMTEAGVTNARAVTDAIAKEGPLAMAHFLRFYAKEPTAVMLKFGEVSKSLTVTTASNIGTAFTNGAAGVAVGAANMMRPAYTNVRFTLNGILSMVAQTAANVKNILSGGTILNLGDEAEAAGDAFEKIYKKFEDVGGGGGGGGGAAVKELKTMLDGFEEAFADSTLLNGMADKYGEAGAEIMQKFTKAVNANKEDAEGAGKDFAKSIEDIIKDLNNSEVPNAAALGANLIQAAAKAIREQTPEAVAAMEDAFRQVTDAMNFEKNMKLSGSTLGDSLAKAFKDAALEDKIGSAGMSIMDKFAQAIKEGGRKNIDAVGDAVGNMATKLLDKVGKGGAYDSLTASLMTAANDYANNQTPELLAKLEAAMANIKIIMDGGAFSVASNTFIMSDAVKQLASSLGVSAEDIVKNIELFIKTGLFGMLDKLTKLPSEVKDIIDKILAEVKAGKKSIEQAAKEIKDISSGLGGSTVDTLRKSLDKQSIAGILGLDPAATKAFFERWDSSTQNWKDMVQGVAGNIGGQQDRIARMQENIFTNRQNLTPQQVRQLQDDIRAAEFDLRGTLQGGGGSGGNFMDEFVDPAQAEIQASMARDAAAYAEQAKARMKEQMEKAKIEQYSRNVSGILANIQGIVTQLNSGNLPDNVMASLRAELKMWREKLKKAGDDIEIKSISKENSSTGMGKIPGFAGGIRGFMGGYALVGEGGPEIVKLPRGSNVYSNSESKGMGAVTVVLNINSPVTDSQSLRRYIPQIREELRRLDKR